MSLAATFDTLQFVNRLEKAGVPREHAAVFVEIQKDILSEAVANQLSTKGDIRELKNEIARLDNKLDVSLARQEGEMKLLKWMVGLSIALSTGTFGLVARLLIILPH